MLPFIELNRLYEQFYLDEPWDSPHNVPLSQETPRCYRSWLGGSDNVPGLTPYQVLIGPGTAFERPGLTFDDFPDGPANTMLVVEAADPVPWARPVDLAYHPDEPLPRFNDQYNKPVKLACYNIAWHKGFLACLGDGRYQFIRASTDEQFIRAIITRNGGEPVNASRLD
jgi:hypothetical protein